MLISYSHKFIFFHIAKAAGSSIKEALQSYAQEPEKFKINRPQRMLGDKINPLYEIWESSLWHAKAKDVQKEFSPEIYNSFYKFAFVRNPWDWQVSYYHFILKEKAHIRHELVKSMAGFEEYLKWVINTKNPFPKGATKLQKEIITDSQGRLIVDYIGRYETLATDLNYVCQQLNLQTSLPYLNQSKHRNYQEYYNPKTIKLVEEHFQEDIALFGYTFDGYSAEIGQGIQKQISSLEKGLKTTAQV
ncbi:sulfotransferase family 2 domain-containing protein [Aphanizomenon sp. UHCC 0183]|uniref:sulfotransferase family 2 domain-containing protein n=1 Tax=Aphanizomenon sp. UHCC 0183 TaxID=2590028 RepID=UPI001445BD0D|nr:sulfotransferase family 2 domain-containing protein [Aphanizomenon sp. UHCC 0183]MTJ29320.1 sulfotransferase family protein [Aphanizomenon sp. UHCC 0183]